MFNEVLLRCLDCTSERSWTTLRTHSVDNTMMDTLKLCLVAINKEFDHYHSRLFAEFLIDMKEADV